MHNQLAGGAVDESQGSIITATEEQQATEWVCGAQLGFGARSSSSWEHVNGVVSFIEAGLTAGEPAAVFAPAFSVGMLRDGLNGSARDVAFFDAAELGRNPARIIPAAQRFADAQRGPRIRVVVEPIWPGRSAADIREAIRHEALVNVLFADVGATVLCTYDAAGLDSAVIADAARTHPHITEHGEYLPNPLYADPFVTLAASDRLPLGPDDADSLTFVGHDDLSKLRRLVRDRTRGLSPERVRDLVLAVNEAATNTVEHTRQPGVLRIWRDGDTLVCEVSDQGHIVAPHRAGRLTPRRDARRGRGLWMINQVCDLVELRSSATGTVIRMHVAIR